MKLIEALEIIKEPAPADAPPFRIFLACGFTPLHLETFLIAHTRRLRSLSRIEVRTGIYGDLAGSLERIAPEGLEAVAAVVEWADLDPRLGIRNLGGWRVTDVPDIVESARKTASRIGNNLRYLAEAVPVCLCLPTLPLPPLFVDPPERCGRYELELREVVCRLTSSIAGSPGLRVVNPQALDQLSPSEARFDVESAIVSGFPWTIGHASGVAQLLAALILKPTPKKGLITDLDDTLWAGILGEVGDDNLAWDMERQAQAHGLYQQLLASLASAGVLIGVASKNAPDLVEKAFERRDLLLTKDSIFPFEIHWGSKSGSVKRIMETWNIGPDDVVFVDDSPMELAEVRAACPGIECLHFPKNDLRAVWGLLKHLRGVFGKDSVSEEDLLRLGSIRAAVAFRGHVIDGIGSTDDFLRAAEAKIIFSLTSQPGDARALELVNKTNQFNLNGRRWTEPIWAAHFLVPGAFLLTATYEDKFGPLGKIAALLGRRKGQRLDVDAWVMSCRAFSRRIEHQFLKYLFEKVEVEDIMFDFEPTVRNGPLQDFFKAWFDGPPTGPFLLSRGPFFSGIPALFHGVNEDIHDRTT